MITNPSVFVTGAGASVSYGFPLGPDLVTHIIAATRDNTSGMRDSLMGAGFRDGDLNDFWKTLEGTDSRSIDAFLEGAKDEFKRIGKAVIALVILNGEAKCKNERLLIGNPPADHWLGHVWSLMRDGATDVNSFRMNRVSFITFNYERTIEEYFTTVLRHNFELSVADAIELRKLVIEIVHLHGSIPDDQAFGHYMGPSFPGVLTKNMSLGIKIISDSIAADDVGWLRAHDILRDAQRVCLLGFGYHPENIRRLNLHGTLAGSSRLFGSTYKMGGALVVMAKQRIVREMAMGALPAESFLKEHVPLD